VPHRPLTIYYLHSLILAPNALPRLCSHRTISQATIIYLCGTSREKRTEMDVWRLIKGNPIAPTHDVSEGDPWRVSDAPVLHVATIGRQSNRQQRVKKTIAEDVPDAFADVIPEPEGERVRRYDSEEEDPEEREGATRLSQQVTRITHNYPVQIFAKVPNRRGLDESWCLLDEEERDMVGFNIFCDKTRLPELFHSYVSVGYNADKWRKTVQAYFPTSAEQLAMRDPRKKIQGLVQLQAWSDWEFLLATVPPACAKTLVKETRDHVNKRWQWLPCLAKNHLWPTGMGSLSRAGRVVGPTEGGPWIVLNPRFRY
jgi:hypothetical protein